MDAMLQRHCARYIYVVPDGLKELMSDISREVLRNQPEDLCVFIADYLDALLITRENARVAAQFVQNMFEASETIVDILDRTGMSREEADDVAEVIQNAFRTWSSKKGILKEDEDTVVTNILEKAGINEFQAQDAAVCIQHAYRAFKKQKEKEEQLLGGVIDWRVAARSAIKLYRRTGVSTEEAKRAANMIKAAYKGYYTRKAIKKLNEASATDEYYDREVMEEESEEEFSLTNISEKKKGVRIDYQSVVPHVDFGDEAVISKEGESYTEEERKVEKTVEEAKVQKEELPKDISDEVSTVDFIKGVLDTYVDRALSSEKIKIKESVDEAVQLSNAQIDVLEVVVEEAVKEDTEVSPEGLTEQTAEVTTEQTAEDTTEQTAEVTTEQTAEVTTEQTAADTTDQTAEVTTEQTADVTIEPSVEAPSEPTTEEPNEPLEEATTEPTTEEQTEPENETNEPMEEEPVAPPTFELTPDDLAETMTNQLLSARPSEAPSEPPKLPISDEPQ